MAHRVSSLKRKKPATKSEFGESNEVDYNNNPERNTNP
jgi:hypothetical protein